jgi:uncharacterized protein YuzE
MEEEILKAPIVVEEPLHVYVKISDKKHKETKEIYPMVFADFDENGKLIGIEFVECQKATIQEDVVIDRIV